MKVLTQVEDRSRFEVALPLTTTVDLIRHGQPVGGRRYRGQTDDPLSEEGWQQMWRTVGDCREWDHIVTSPLQRCSAFARELGRQRGIPVSVDPRLMEVRFGVWEGHTPDELRGCDPEVLVRFYHDPVRERPPGAEPLTDFFDRVTSGFGALLEQYLGRHLLVVCHAGVVRMIVAHILHIPLQSVYRIQVASAGATRLRLEQGMPPTLVFHGRASF